MSTPSSQPAGPEISIALCTCNGGAYVREQLESYAAQERLPDELVVCDDRSTDQTIDVIREFAGRAPFPVRVEINEQRLGSSANFAKAIGLCRGRWIFLSDQDDAWMPHKTRRMLESAAARPEVGLWFSDAVMVDSQRKPLGYRLWEAICLTRRDRSQLERGQLTDVLLRRNVVSGLTVALRAEYREMILPIPTGWVHDGWIALLIAAVAPCAAISEPLVEYRQHPKQQIGEAKRTLYQQYLRAKQIGQSDVQGVAANYRAAHDRLDAYRSRLRDAGILAALEEKAAHFQVRTQVRGRRAGRWPLVLGQWLRGHYGRYSSGWKSLARDLLV